MVIHFVSKEKWPDVLLFTEFIDCGHWIDWMVRGLEKALLENW